MIITIIISKENNFPSNLKIISIKSTKTIYNILLQQNIQRQEISVQDFTENIQVFKFVLD